MSLEDETPYSTPLRVAIMEHGWNADEMCDEGRRIVAELEAYLLVVTRHATLGRMMIDELERIAAGRVARGLPEFKNDGEIGIARQR